MGYIYKIINNVNNKVYIGQTVNTIEQRFIEHKSHYKSYKNSNRPLYNAFRKYGENNFKIIELEQIDNEMLNEREKYWINFYDSYNNGYNATLGGDTSVLYDYKKIISLYKEIQNISEVARQLGCHYITVKRILKQYNIPIVKAKSLKDAIPIQMLNKTTLIVEKTFNDLEDCVNFIIENNFSTNKASNIKQKIKEVCLNKRKTAYSFVWRYVKEEKR